MPLNLRSPAGDQPAAYTHPISRSLAVTVLAALVLLWALRHLFGNVSVNAGVK